MKVEKEISLYLISELGKPHCSITVKDYLINFHTEEIIDFCFQHTGFFCIFFRIFMFSSYLFFGYNKIMMNKL